MCNEALVAKLTAPVCPRLIFSAFLSLAHVPCILGKERRLFSVWECCVRMMHGNKAATCYKSHKAPLCRVKGTDGLVGASSFYSLLSSLVANKPIPIKANKETRACRLLLSRIGI